MIPIRKKKKSLEITVDEMRNFALTYVEKYAKCIWWLIQRQKQMMLLTESNT